jgi:hypothetical protein
MLRNRQVSVNAELKTPRGQGAVVPILYVGSLAAT